MKLPNEIKTTGFTLIELLVAILIVGILATIGFQTLGPSQIRARDANRKNDLRQIQNALRLYYNDRGKYPDNDASDFSIKGCADGNSKCAWGSAWAIGTTVYMQILPDDPTPARDYRYARTSLDGYTLDACLENKNDKSGITAGNWCPSALMFEVKQ